MAARRACVNALEGRIAGARGASSSPRRFASNWAAAICRRSIQTQTTAVSTLSTSTILKATSPSWLQSRRQFSSSPASRHGHLDPPRPGEERKVTFVDKDGHASTFEVADGDNLLDIAQANDIEMEGACGGSCACSTCHVIVEDEAYYDKMEEPDDDENDMLDLAFGLTETSRLGCQVKMSKELDGLVVRLPSMTRNLQASDFDSK
ncbi:mitochondrial matrix iron-sulfur protein [Alternaria novae-zelandiae]|uniref:mitochondrial matrix iron-sulfur protein n=1 Tax=Alternaria novae-zelandiae TaxID=430562 RepID=UPI0020C2A2CE|nr:mitochondrial matrix iron-sulfur protein [Alternaria novae-zelandiae]KAI4682321.1 mitochondrial matrix iron-sulfur protein [Alternaria novae-zelandiae]